MNLREQILAEIERREKVAKAAFTIGSSDPWRALYGDRVVAQVDGESTYYGIAKELWEEHAEHIALHDPADALRRYAHYRKVLERHAPVSIGEVDDPLCSGCRDYAGHLGWPCVEIEDLAEALGLSTEEDR